jgi:hypothetical protein
MRCLEELSARLPTEKALDFEPCLVLHRLRMGSPKARDDLSGSRRVPKGFWGRWLWDLFDAVLLLALLNCAWLSIQYAIHAVERARLQGEIERYRVAYDWFGPRAQKLIEEAVQYSKKNPRVAVILVDHGFKQGDTRVEE